MIGEVPSRSRIRMRLLKVQPGSTVDCVIVGSELASLRLHWIGGRSYVCPGGDCPACLEIASRWSGFLPVSVVMRPASPKGVYLLEVTEAAWARFDDLCRLAELRELFRLHVSVMRRRRKEPLLMEPLDHVVLGERNPVSVSMCYDALATLYCLPSFMEGETPADWSARVESAARHHLALAMDRARQ